MKKAIKKAPKIKTDGELKDFNELDENEETIEEEVAESKESENVEYLDDELVDGSEDQDNCKKTVNYNKIINIIFVVVLILLALVTIDVVSVSRFNVGPFFAIRTRQYKDGGTREYYGLGYKVIKYNCDKGRKGTDIGSWKLKYQNEPIEISSLDLAIQYNDNTKEIHEKLYRKYIQVDGEVTKTDSNMINISFIDPQKKYNLNLICTLAEDAEDYSNIKTGDKIVIKGVVKNFQYKSGTEDNKLFLENCYINM